MHSSAASLVLEWRQLIRERMENVATLAANATDGIVQILNGEFVFHVRKAIDLDVRTDGEYCLVEFAPIGICGRGRDQEEALASFADQFRGIWESIVSADDGKLTQDARLLKRRMRRLVQSVNAGA